MKEESRKVDTDIEEMESTEEEEGSIVKGTIGGNYTVMISLGLLLSILMGVWTAGSTYKEMTMEISRMKEQMREVSSKIETLSEVVSKWERGGYRR